MCARQILGVRMALLGLNRLGIQDPRGADRKRLVTYIEIDRCATDAIGMVTGCRLGKRTLKFRDWGKMTAAFVDLTTGRGVRIIALEDSRELAQKLYPHIENKGRAADGCLSRTSRRPAFSRALGARGCRCERTPWIQKRTPHLPTVRGRGELWPLQRSGWRKVVSKLRTA